MTTPTPAGLLTAEVHPTFVTFFLTVHTALRRDVAAFAAVLDTPLDADAASALAELWQKFDESLHGHHEGEDERLFPMLLEREPALKGVMDDLAAEHEALDPLLSGIGAAIGALPEGGAQAEARGGVAELGALLERHLSREERDVVPVMRRPEILAAFPTPELPPEGATIAWLLAGSEPEDVDTVVRHLVAGEVPDLDSHRRRRAELEARAGFRAQPARA